VIDDVYGCLAHASGKSVGPVLILKYVRRQSIWQNTVVNFSHGYINWPRRQFRPQEKLKIYDGIPNRFIYCKHMAPLGRQEWPTVCCVTERSDYFSSGGSKEL
jgi:hypothetical protein